MSRCIACDNELIEGQCPMHGDLTDRVGDAWEALERVKIALTARANTSQGITYHTAMQAVESVQNGLSR